MRRCVGLITLLTVLLSVSGTVAAEPLPVMLERGIYAEETKGNLDEAISIYKKVIAAQAADSESAAEASYRLGNCYLKKGEQQKARAALEAVLTRFSDQKTIADKAQKRLNELNAKSFVLGPAPWKDGEVMELGLKTAAGLEIGTVIWSANLVDVGGRQAWRIEQRLFVTANNSEQYTRVDADKNTFAPIASVTDNQLGEFRAKYGKNNVALTSNIRGNKSTAQMTTDGVVYDNEQALFLIRRLPFKQGYNTVFPIFPVQGGAVVDCKIEVIGKEFVTVPAGRYDCWKLQLSVYDKGIKALEHTLWVTADANRYVAKYNSGQMIMDLTKIANRPAGSPSRFVNSDPGISLDLPAGWFAYKNPSPGNYLLYVQLLPSELKSWASLLAARRTADARSARAVAEGDINVLKGFFQNYSVREGSWTGPTVGDLAPVSFVADYNDQGKKMVEYRTYGLTKSIVYWLVFRVDAVDFAADRAIFTAIAASLKPQETKQVFSRKPDYSQNQRIELSADGRGGHTVQISFINKSSRDLREMSFINDRNDIEGLLDENGQELEFTSTREGKHYRFRVQLKTPVKRSERCTYSLVMKPRPTATKKDGVWTYRRYHVPGPETDYTETIDLPFGAKVVSVDPEPQRNSVVGGRPEIQFKTIIQPSKPFRCEIKYEVR